MAAVPALALPAATAATAATSVDDSASVAASTCYQPCIQGIRFATHDGYDRLVFDFNGKTDFTTETNTTGLYTPLSGQDTYLTTKGASYLFIRMTPASFYDDAGNQVFTSPMQQVVDLPTLKGIQLTGVHAGVISFGISLGPSTRYNAFQLTQPDRLVIDVYR
ncbi:AMIN-like domain-containing (lipo)protein [Streptomyces sp. BE230]|uniref:AMIN-like domain-containing (lipo)protein n=1 Tax=Streptomyces sp. BE230 TaxID=3002526 RepID=UPI002ED022C5|nr:hypothetical protein [Streptomyces sp. BE230]